MIFFLCTGIIGMEKIKGFMRLISVSAASDAEEGENTTKPIQGATKLVKK